jgi:TM2 domain-containing membrane protein YozV
MTELPYQSDQTPSLPGPAAKPTSRWKRAALAGLLSLLFSGMGQLYNRQPRKGLFLALISLMLGMAMVKTRLLFTFSKMVPTILALVLWKFFVAGEAAYSTATGKGPESIIPLPRLLYPLLAVVFCCDTVPVPRSPQKRGGLCRFQDCFNFNVSHSLSRRTHRCG